MAVVGAPAGGPVAAIFPPWWNATRAVNAAASGGAVLRPGMAEFVVLVAPDLPQGRDRIRQAGAWLLLNVGGLTGCGLKAGAN